MRVHAILPPKADTPVPSVIVLHYWGATDLRTERAQAQRLAQRGIAAIIVELPYHMDRAPGGTRSGELAIIPDPAKLIATMTQAVFDIRRTVDWIQSRNEFDPNRIGLVGTSLGGVVGSLAFAIEPRIRAFCSVLGGVQIAELIWHSSRLVREREKLRREGFSKERLAIALEPIEPSRFLKGDERRPTYLIAARYDTVIPRVSYQSLVNALGNPPTLWIHTGHYGGYFVQDSLLRTVVDFFVHSFAGEQYEPPGRLFAPTLRLTGTANTGSGLQVGLGLDVWRNNDEAGLVGTLIFTPKGPEGFLGTRVSSGLSLGIAVLPRRTTLGAMWSFVL